MSHSVKRFDGKNPELKKEFDKTEPVIISGPENIASFVSEKRLGGKPKISFLMLSRRNQVIGNLITEFDSYEGNEEALAEQMVKLGVRHGASSVVPYGNVEMQRGSVKKLSQLVKELSGKNLTVLDALCIENGLSYESAQNNFLLEGEAAYGDKRLADTQGNPVDESGNLIINTVETIDAISDQDFIASYRNVGLPPLPEIIRRVLSSHGKQVILKKNILERNARRHGDLTPDKSRMILKEALNNPTLYGRNKPLTRPNNWIVINVPDGKGNNKLVVLEVNENKKYVEIVHWHEVDERGLEKIRRQAEREDGQLLILPTETSVEAGALSGPTQGMSSEGKGSENSADSQVNEDKTSGEAKEKRVEELAEWLHTPYPKDNIEWLKWIQSGKAIRIVGKEKIQAIIDSQRTTNTVESERIGLNLDDVAKVVKNFENPSIVDKKC